MLRKAFIVGALALAACGAEDAPVTVDGRIAEDARSGVDGSVAADARVATDALDRDADSSTPLPGTCDLPIAAPPASLGLDPFYKKYVDIGGVPLISSDKVRDAAFKPACENMVHMMQLIPEARAELVRLRVRVGIMAESEVTTDMPEHSDLNEVFPGTDWDTRARGLGATIARPLSSVGEENLLKLQSDPYLGESIMVHEFGHTLFNMGIEQTAGGGADTAMLDQLYASAIGDNLWTNTYAATNRNEYWAEGVQSWFGVNAEAVPTNGIHNHVNTRAELQAYDPDLATFISRFFVAADAPY